MPFCLNNEQESFKEALNEVYKSEKFPLRRYKMKDALDNDCSDMEKEVGKFFLSDNLYSIVNGYWYFICLSVSPRSLFSLVHAQ